MKMRYAVIFEKTNTGYCAHAPDVPRCFSTGATLEEAKQNIKQALEFHLEGEREDGLATPEPLTEIGYVDLTIPAPANHDVPAL